MAAGPARAASACASRWRSARLRASPRPRRRSPGRSAGDAPAAAPRNPFGAGLREAAPAARASAAWLLAVQGEFARSLQGACWRSRATARHLDAGGLGFLYGVFHAAGPGHGKAVIAAYLVSSERALVKGLALSLAAALVQAVVAVALVATAAALLTRLPRA